MAYYIKEKERNSIEIYFESRPSGEICSHLRSCGWKYVSNKKCWWGLCTADNEVLANFLCEEANSDEIKKSHLPNEKKKIHLAETTIHHTSSYRRYSPAIERDYANEKLFGISEIRMTQYIHTFDWWDGTKRESGRIIGEIFADDCIKKSFCLKCILYDSDGDIIGTYNNKTYGGGQSTYMVKPSSFFNGYPFEISFIVDPMSIEKMKLVISEHVRV